MPSRSAAPGADSQGPQSHQWSHARPTPFTASRCPRHPAAHVAPPGHPRTALPSLPRPQRCPKSSTKAPRPGHPAHGTSMRPIRVPKKTEIRPKLQLFCDCELPRGVKTRIDARKSGKSDAQRPISASRRTERSPQSQKSCTEVGIFVFAKRIVVTEQFLRKTRVPSMPIRPSSSTEPQGIDHASTHALTLGKNPALARLKNATSEEKRWAK